MPGSWRCVLVLLSFAGVDCVVTTLAEAVQRQLFLEKLDTFIYDQFNWGVTDFLHKCVVRSNAFKSNCTDNNVQDSYCQVGCTDPQYTNQSSCQANSHSWNSQNAPNNQCCKDGSVECGYNAAGTEEEDCCDGCIAGATPEFEGSCSFEGFEGPSVCGTTAGDCYQCLGSNPRSSPQTDQGSCSNGGVCNISLHYTDRNSCESAGGSWTPAVWHHFTNLLTKSACTDLDYCGHCNNTGSNDPSSCVNNGGEWLREYGIDRETCENERPSGHEWIEVRKFDAGDELPAPPMKRASCSTGPDHAMTVDHCMDPEQYLADAAALTFQEARKNYSSFYTNTFNHWRQVARAVVTNSVNATDRAALGIRGGCLMGIFEPKNKGRITVNGRADGKTYILIARPTNYADADSIVVRNASVAVIGGSSGGPIDVADAPKVEVTGVENSGDIIVTRSQDIFISNVKNLGSAEIKVIDVTATLNHVTNEGRVIVKQGGTYRAYNVINNGTVQIEAGGISIQTICPSSGMMTISAGVVGNISYERGCMGTIFVDGVNVTQTLLDGGSVGSSVHFQEIVKVSKVVTGSVGMTVPDADTFILDAVALNAVKEGIAENLGVDPLWVAVAATKSRRLSRDSDKSDFRQLVGTSVSISYTINFPVSASTAIVTATEGKLQSVTPAQLTSSVSAKMQQAKGNSYSVTVTSKTMPIVEVATTTTPVPTTTVPTTSTAAPVTSTSAPTTTLSSGDVEPAPSPASATGDGDGSTTETPDLSGADAWCISFASMLVVALAIP